LAKLLAEHRGVRNFTDLPTLTIKQILIWADEHKAVTGKWPHRNSGLVTGTDETWGGIDGALHRGRRGIVGDSSLAKLLFEHRGVRYTHDLSPLTIKQILAWADEFKAASGAWPNHISGPVAGTDETWSGINQALGAGRRGLPGGTSLAKLLEQRRAQSRP
jgi:hypothetical protein